MNASNPSRPGLSPAQACQLAALAAHGAEITSVRVHPFSGAAVVYHDRETVAIYAPDGAQTYKGRA
jgi:hypothetical protein